MKIELYKLLKILFVTIPLRYLECRKKSIKRGIFLRSSKNIQERHQTIPKHPDKTKPILKGIIGR